MPETAGFLLLVATVVVWWQWRFGIGDALRTIRRIRSRGR
jgi:hypothetical protein